MAPQAGEVPDTYQWHSLNKEYLCFQGVLNSAVAIQVHIQIIRIFTKMRELLLSSKDILLKLERMEKDVKEKKKILL